MQADMDDAVTRLEKYRLEHKIPQEDLAKKLGVAFSTVNRWLNRKTRPSKTQHHHIKKLLQQKGGAMDSSRIEQIQKRHAQIYQEYKRSDKTNFAFYWRQLEALEAEYFREKHGAQQTIQDDRLVRGPV